MAEDYFIRTKLRPAGTKNLRACQLEALEELSKFPFNTGGSGSQGPDTRALVVMPTGTGKSLLMLAAPYWCSWPGRCVVLTPKPVITGAVLNSLHKLHRLLPQNHQAQPPQVVEIVRTTESVSPKPLEGDVAVPVQRTHAADPACGRKLLGANFIVMNIHKFSQAGLLEVLERMGRESMLDIGALLVDEAHHIQAPSWQAAQSFVEHNHPEVRVVYLTATPFRCTENMKLDKFSTPVYTCSIKRAIQESWVKNLVFHEVFLSSALYTKKTEGEQTNATCCMEMMMFDTDQLDRDRNCQSLIHISKPDEVLRTQVLEKAIESLAKKRLSGSKLPHKMLIKVPMGADMQDVVELAELLGNKVPPFNSGQTFRVACTFSGDKEEAGKLSRFESDSEEDEIVAMVVKEKLKEGYDLKLISVVALLDPMGINGLGSFMQSVGRMLRRIEHGSQAENSACVVGHQLHDLHQFWERFRKEMGEGGPITRRSRTQALENLTPTKDGYVLSPSCIRTFPFLEHQDMVEEQQQEAQCTTPPPSLFPHITAAALLVGAEQRPSDFQPGDLFPHQLELRVKPERPAGALPSGVMHDLRKVQTMLQGEGLDVSLLGVSTAAWLTKDKVIRALQDLIQDHNVQLKVVYLCGHSCRPTGDLVLGPVRGEVMRAEGDDAASTSPLGAEHCLSFDEVLDMWRKYKLSGQYLVVVLDAGCSGSWVERLREEGGQDDLNMAVQASSGPSQPAIDGLFADAWTNRFNDRSWSDEEPGPQFHCSWGDDNLLMLGYSIHFLQPDIYFDCENS